VLRRLAAPESLAEDGKKRVLSLRYCLGITVQTRNAATPQAAARMNGRRFTR
jgi:hypothetical protein